jgi:hypothetical protein
MQQFIDDIRALAVPAKFEGGNDKQRIHLNEGIEFMQGIKTAAERAVQNDDTIQIYCVFNGGLTLVEFKAQVLA